MSAKKIPSNLSAPPRTPHPFKRRGFGKDHHRTLPIRLPWIEQLRRQPQSCLPAPDPPRAHAYAPPPNNLPRDGPPEKWWLLPATRR